MEVLNKERLLFIALAFFGAALGVRWIAIMQNYVIANDATLYIKSAKLYSMGFYAEGFNARSTFPLLIALSQKLFGDWVSAGQWVSAFLGALTVVPLYLLARCLFDDKVAFLTAIFYSICPSLVKNSTEVLRDMPSVFFYITALWLGYKGIREGRVGMMGLAGVFILLSASIKDYGLVLFASLLLLLIWFVFHHIATWKQALMLSTLFIGSAILIVIFFGIFLNQRGFSMHAPIIARTKVVLAGIKDQKERSLEIEKKIESSEIGPQDKRLLGLAVNQRFALYSYYIVYKTVHAFNFILFILFIFGVIKRKFIPYRKDEFVLFSLYATYIPLFLLHLNVYNFLQTKNTFPLVVPSLIWSGVGFVELKNRVTRLMNGRDFPLREWMLRWGTPLFLLVICIPLLSTAWAPHRKDKLELREIGLWLKDNGYVHSIVVGQHEFARLAFYADGDFMLLPKGSYQDIVRFAREKGASLLVISRKNIDHISPHFLDMASPSDLRPINIPGIKTPEYATMVFRVEGLRENK